MSGHSKWHSIKHKKGAADAARGKVFTKHAKLIQVAARGGSDPEMNPTLRVAIDNAKADNVPNSNIERAVKKGSGELKDGSIIEETSYEGYGPDGVALLINCLTDNKNRTVSNIKAIFNKNGGNMGENGSVSWMFKRIGSIEIDLEENDADEVELKAIDAGADDIEHTDNIMIITCSPENVISIKDTLSESGIKVLKATTDQKPDNLIKISDKESAKKILRLIEKLEEDDDVESVASNFDIEESLMEEISSEL